MTHPEELLAEYVDGSLERDERAVVDAHLAGCERCRGEVAGARRARETLAALPEVELPEGFRADRRARRVRPAPRARHERLRRTTLAIGAVAASVAATVWVAVLIGNGGGGGAPSPMSGAGAAGNHAAAGPSYDVARVNALADSLARAARRGEPLFSSSDNAVAGQVQTPTSSHGPESAAEPSVPQSSPGACVRAAGRVPDSARPLRSIASVTFDGSPAYLAAYRVGDSIRVVVVSRSNCSVLYTTSRPFR